MTVFVRRTALLLVPAAGVAAIGIGLSAATASADDFNPQPDPPGKHVAISSFQQFQARFTPPDPCHQGACGLPAVQVHESLITRFGGTTVGGGPGTG
jgi:hypothetical protein